jgi:hypothetical protein
MPALSGERVAVAGGLFVVLLGRAAGGRLRLVSSGLSLGLAAEK